MSALLGGPFIAVTGELIRTFGLGPAVVLQEIHFRTLHDETETLEASQRLIADRVGLNRRQVQRYVGKLVDLGVLEAVAANSSTGDQTLTYSIDVDLVEALAAAANGGRVQKRTGPKVDRGGPNMDRDRSKNGLSSKKKNVEEEKKLTREPFEEDFDEAWSIYPRKTNRKGSLRSYQARRREKVPADDLLAATRAYASSRIGEDPAFTMHGSTFYGPNERYVDWLEVYRANQAAGLLAPSPGSVPVRLVTCGLCLGSTWWQSPEREREPIDPNLDRCPACEGTGKTEATPTDESEPF